MLQVLFRQRWLQMIFGTLVVLFGFWLVSSGESTVKPAWTTIQKSDFFVRVGETGEIRAVNSVDIKAPMEWRMDLQIIQLTPEGKTVKKGDLLVQFDITTLMQELDLAKEELQVTLSDHEKLSAQQDARLKQLQNDKETSIYSREIAKLQLELLKYEAAVRREEAALELEKAQIALNEAETRIGAQKIIDQSNTEQLKVRMQKARAEIASLELQISNLTLRAPADGMVVYNEIGNFNSRHKVTEGDKVRPGENIISIPDLNAMQVNLRVNEMDALQLQVGQEGKITLDAYPEKIFTGKIVEIARLAQKEDSRSSIKDFEVILSIHQSDSLLKPGMTAKAELILAHLQNVYHVPIGAVYEREEQAVIFPKKGYPKPLPVKIAQRTDDRIVISAETLNIDEQIAFHAPHPSFQRVGYAEYNLPKKSDNEIMAQAFAEMDARGLGYDYNANRDRRVIADAEPGGSPVDIEKVRQQFRDMAKSGKAVETDPDLMKRLQESLKGAQPGQLRMIPKEKAENDTTKVGKETVKPDSARRIILQAPADTEKVTPDLMVKPDQQ